MIRNVHYQPPFPWFGGKSPVAATVWSALGDPPNYVEPFAGSAAALLLRPNVGHIETINDADGFVANFWRALKHDPEAVAEAADNPVNEADLHARHLWLLGERERLTERLMGDTEFYDAKAAGWWCWGQCCWIGSGWCSGRGSWVSEDGVMVMRNPGQGVNQAAEIVDHGPGKAIWRQLPHLGNPGQGVNRQLPHLGNPGQGVKRQLPHLGDPGKGVNRQLPHLGDPGKEREPETAGECEKRRAWLISYLNGFADRLRNVRVCCGDWSRVCGPSVTYRHGMTGVFLDPPYADTATRTEGLYATDCQQVAHAVREWAIEHGEIKGMRIVLAGYEGEHDMPASWRVVEWKAVGGYGLIADDEEQTGRSNRRRERLWLSPQCCKPSSQGSLF